MQARLPELLPPVTARQYECLRYIYDYFRRHQYYPSQREICSAMNLRTATAATYLIPLGTKGYVRKDPASRRRNIRLTEEALRLIEKETKKLRY